MIISSHNEWDPLKSVVVGTATNANFPIYDMLFQLQMSQAGWDETLPPSGPVDERIIDETNEDLQNLSNTLVKLDIQVYRPDEVDYRQKVSTTDWSVDGQYGYCPRDNLLVIGDQVIEAPMSTRARQHEMIMFNTIRNEAIQHGYKWYSAPRPRLLDFDNGITIGKFKLTNNEPIFDAANILRMDKDLLYLVSSSGNRLGAQWLQTMLGDEYKVHVTDVYNSAHIDSTIVPISDDTVLLNANRVNEDNVPELFKDWNKIYITEDMIEPQDFIGYPYASKWIAINMLALGNKKVVLDKKQHKIIDLLDKQGFDVILSELRHSRTLGGGFHCVTLDLHREKNEY